MVRDCRTRRRKPLTHHRVPGRRKMRARAGVGEKAQRLRAVKTRAGLLGGGSARSIFVELGEKRAFSYLLFREDGLVG